MFEAYKLKRSIMKAELEYQDLILQNVVKTLRGATTSNVVQPEPDEENWLQMGQDDAGRLSETDYGTMWDKTYEMWCTNLYARAVIRTMNKFVIGKGAIIRFTDSNEKVEEIWANFKYESTNSENSIIRKRKWNLKEKEIFTRLFREGEVIMRIFRGGTDEDGLVKMRFIRSSRIKTPVDKKDHNDNETVSYGIGHDPDDIETYKTYYLCDSEGNLQPNGKISANDILHYKIFADSDVKRGVSLLKICAPMLKKYEDWMEDRITLNKARTAIALIRKVDSPIATVQKIRDSLQSEVQSSDRKKMKMFERGTMLTASKGIDYQMLSPNINAQDVKDDGRSMLLAVAAAVGFPEMILTADFSNANYSSTMIAQNPFVREIEDWQDFAETIYCDLIAVIIQNAIENGPLPKTTSTECEIGFAPMIHSDMKKEDESYEIEHRNKVLSRKTWQLKRGLDPNKEKANLEEEVGDEVYPPVKLPTDDKEIPSEEDEFEYEDEEFSEEDVV